MPTPLNPLALFAARYAALIAAKAPATHTQDGEGAAGPAPEPLDFSRADITFDRDDITWNDTEA